MKIWTSEHVFGHPWDVVVKASFRKYPNPLNTAVKKIDVLDRKIESDGALYSHRLITSEWGLPKWALKILGLTSNKTCYASEHSKIDLENKKMTLKTTNLTFCKELSLIEKLTYIPHPEKFNEKTLLKQEAMITVHGIPLSNYIENLISTTISVNANKGRQAMEYVINKINSEMHEFTKKADGLAATAKRCIPDEISHLNYQIPKN